MSVLLGCFPPSMSRACRRMFSILATSRSPYFWLSTRALPGMSVWTWTLKISSSSLMTRESPMLSRYRRRGSRFTLASRLRTTYTVSKMLTSGTNTFSAVKTGFFSSFAGAAWSAELISPRREARMAFRMTM